MRTVMTNRALRPMLFSQNRFACRNHAVFVCIKLVAALLNFKGRAIPLERFLILAIGDIRMFVRSSRHAHQLFHAVVIRRQLVIADRPRRKIVRAVAPTQARPQQGFAAHRFREEMVYAPVARLCEGFFLTIHSQTLSRIPPVAVLWQFVWHRMRLKILRRVNPLPCFEHNDGRASFGELHCHYATRRARADDTDIINLRGLLHFGFFPVTTCVPSDFAHSVNEPSYIATS